MIRFILYVLIFFLIYRVIKLVAKFFIEQKKKNASINYNTKPKTDYRNVVDADFIEIDNETGKEK